MGGILGILSTEGIFWNQSLLGRTVVWPKYNDKRSSELGILLPELANWIYSSSTLSGDQRD